MFNFQNRNLTSGYSGSDSLHHCKGQIIQSYLVGVAHEYVSHLICGSLGPCEYAFQMSSLDWFSQF